MPAAPRYGPPFHLANGSRTASPALDHCTPLAAYPSACVPASQVLAAVVNLLVVDASSPQSIQSHKHRRNGHASLAAVLASSDDVAVTAPADVEEAAVVAVDDEHVGD